jgi:hypothetical protein
LISSFHVLRKDWSGCGTFHPLSRIFCSNSSPTVLACSGVIFCRFSIICFLASSDQASPLDGRMNLLLVFIVSLDILWFLARYKIYFALIKRILVAKRNHVNFVSLNFLTLAPYHASISELATSSSRLW